MKGYDLIRNENEARYSSEKHRQNLLNKNLRFLQSEDEESIAIEENPFDQALLGLNLLNSSPPRRKS